MDRTVSRLIAGHQHNRPISQAQQQHRPKTDRRSSATQAWYRPPAVLAKGSKSCHTRGVSDLFLIMPTAGEYRVVEAVVRTRRLPVALRMCGIGPRRAAALCAEFERGARPRGLALLGWAGGLRDDLAVGDIVIADRALSAGRSDVNCLAPALPGTGARSPRPGADRRPRRRCAGSQACRRGVRCAGRGNGSLPAGSLGCAARGAICPRSCDSRHGRRRAAGVGRGAGRLRPPANPAPVGSACAAAGLAGRIHSPGAPLARGQPAPGRAGRGCGRGRAPAVSRAVLRRQPSLSVRAWPNVSTSNVSATPRPTLATPSGLRPPPPRAIHSMFGRRTPQPRALPRCFSVFGALSNTSREKRLGFRRRTTCCKHRWRTDGDTRGPRCG